MLRTRFLLTVATLTIFGSAHAQSPTRPPAHGMWMDTLDLTKVSGRTPKPGQALITGRGGQPAGTPAPTYPITLDGRVFQHGIGVSANAELWINLDGKAVSFSAIAGIDDARKTGKGSVVFEVWVDGVKSYESALAKSGERPTSIGVDLAGAKTMILYVTDGGDGTTDDIADWGDAAILYSDTSFHPVTMSTPVDPAPKIASSISSDPRLNYPRITGATPGRPFQFRIPASGKGPLTYSARHLPAGLKLDSRTGVISGSLAEAGRTDVSVTITGPMETRTTMTTNKAGKKVPIALPTGVRKHVTGTITIVGGPHALAQTPPLGWNSWNVWGPNVDDEKVRAAADALVKSGLAGQGYTYVNIDDAWEGPRDANGEITSNDKFPDMKALADYVHSKGLKIGIYSGPGPRTCQQRYAASYQHEAQDAATWSKWGFDYIKYDWCSYSDIEPNRESLPGLQKPYSLLRTALDNVDRDFVFSLCQYGWGNVWTWGADVGGNLWRVTGDITDSWSSMSGIGFAQTGHEKYAGPGHWNDTDMLVVGKVGWGSALRDTHLTPNEQLTHISLWSLQAAPLIIGADLSQLDAFTRDLLGNSEVLAVDQDPLGSAAGRTVKKGRTEVWARPLADGTMAVGLFNRDLVAQTITVSWSDLGLAGSQRVRDLWRHKDLGKKTDRFSVVVPRHGVALVKVGTPGATKH